MSNSIHIVHFVVEFCPYFWKMCCRIELIPVELNLKACKNRRTQSYASKFCGRTESCLIIPSEYIRIRAEDVFSVSKPFLIFAFGRCPKMLWTFFLHSPGIDSWWIESPFPGNDDSYISSLSVARPPIWKWLRDASSARVCSRCRCPEADPWNSRPSVCVRNTHSRSGFQKGSQGEENSYI